MSDAHLYEYQKIDKYYRQDHLDKHFEAWMPELKNFKGSVLVAGCGRGDVVYRFGKESVGFDFNPNLQEFWDKIGNNQCIVHDALNLIELGHFDLCVSSDFLEHLSKNDLPIVLNNMLTVAPQGVHIVDMSPETGFRGPNGENLHMLGMDKPTFETYLRDCGFKVYGLEGRLVKFSWGL